MRGGGLCRPEAIGERRAPRASERRLSTTDERSTGRRRLPRPRCHGSRGVPLRRRKRVVLRVRGRDSAPAGLPLGLGHPPAGAAAPIRVALLRSARVLRARVRSRARCRALGHLRGAAGNSLTPVRPPAAALAAHLARKLHALERRYDAQFKVVFDAIYELTTRLAIPRPTCAPSSRATASSFSELIFLRCSESPRGTSTRPPRPCRSRKRARRAFRAWKCRAVPGRHRRTA